MKKTLIFLLSILCFMSCEDKEKLPSNGTLTGTVKYTGASDMAVDNVIITLHREGETAEKGSWRIDKLGEYRFDLPAGEYELKLEGNRCVSKDLPATVKINAGKPTTKDINIEQLPAMAVITGSNENTCPVASVILTAKASNAISYVWYKENAVINGASGNTYEVTRSGTYYAKGINVSGEGIVSDGKNVTITICPAPPAKAAIAGNTENICPAASVTLTASASNASSYKWYKGSSLISGVNGDTYVATQSDIYYAVSINAYGEGSKSNGKSVTIKTCSTPPAKATIAGNRYKHLPEYKCNADCQCRRRNFLQMVYGNCTTKRCKRR